MGKLRVPANLKASWEALDPVFRDEKVIPFVTSLPMDTVLYSAYRGAEKQAALRAVYDDKVKAVAGRFKAGQLSQKQYDDEMAKLRGQIANRPFYSAHNWGVAIDIHPVSYATKDYTTMKNMAGQFGLLRDSVEKWHFQDNRFKRDLVPQWLKAAPDWLSAKTKAVVQAAAKAVISPVFGIVVAGALAATLFFS